MFEVAESQPASTVNDIFVMHSLLAIAICNALQHGCHRIVHDMSMSVDTMLALTEYSACLIDAAVNLYFQATMQPRK